MSDENNNQIVVSDENENNEKNIDLKTKNSLAKMYSKSKLKFFKLEKKNYEDISELKEAALNAIKFGFNKVIEELQDEKDPKRIAMIMRDLQRILASKDLKNLQQVCSANLYNIRKMIDDDDFTMVVKAKGGILSKMFGDIKNK